MILCVGMIGFSRTPEGKGWDLVVKFGKGPVRRVNLDRAEAVAVLPLAATCFISGAMGNGPLCLTSGVAAEAAAIDIARRWE